MFRVIFAVISVIKTISQFAGFAMRYSTTVIGLLAQDMVNYCEKNHVKILTEDVALISRG